MINILDFQAFLIGGVLSATAFLFIGMFLNANNPTNAIWIGTTLIIASVCGCSAQIVKTIEEYHSKDDSK